MWDTRVCEPCGMPERGANEGETPKLRSWRAQ